MTTNATETTRLLTLTDAAEVLQVSRRHLEALIASGDGPDVTRLGASVRIRDDRLRAWLDRRTGSAPPTAAQRASARERGLAWINAMRRDDYAAASRAMPCTVGNGMALEFGGLLLRLLAADEPSPMVAELRRHLDGMDRCEQ